MEGDELRLSDRDMDWWKEATFGMFIHVLGWPG